VQGTLSVGSHITLLGLEGTKTHEIIAVALGSGNAAALSRAIAEAKSTTLSPPPLPSTAPNAVVASPPTAGSAAAPTVPPEEKLLPFSRGEEGRWVSVILRGSVYGVAGPNLLLKRDDGRIVMVDISKLDPSTASRVRASSTVTVVAVPVGNKLQVTGVLEPETGTTGAATR